MRLEEEAVALRGNPLPPPGASFDTDQDQGQADGWGRKKPDEAGIAYLVLRVWSSAESIPGKRKGRKGETSNKVSIQLW
jgi:hypothetical protein